MQLECCESCSDYSVKNLRKNFLYNGSILGAIVKKNLGLVFYWGTLWSMVDVPLRHHSLTFRVFTWSSKRPALARVFWIHLLEVCWRLLDRVNTPLGYSYIGIRLASWLKVDRAGIFVCRKVATFWQEFAIFPTDSCNFPRHVRDCGCLEFFYILHPSFSSMGDFAF